MSLNGMRLHNRCYTNVASFLYNVFKDSNKVEAGGGGGGGGGGAENKSQNVSPDYY